MAKEQGGQIMVAKTILEQLGSGKFIAMTGSKEFIDLGNGLRMNLARNKTCLLYTSPSPRDGLLSRMPSSA